MRLVMSAPTEHPLVWSVTKIENTKPVGLQKLTIYQNFWNEHTDYIEKDADGNIIGMYANYFDSEILPDDTEHLVDDLPFKSVKIVSSTRSIKVGGSYKTFSVIFYSEDGEDITETYNDYKYNWSCVIDDINYSNNVTWLTNANYNQIKIKLPNDKSLLGKIIKIQCSISKDTGKEYTVFDYFDITG